MTTPTTTIEMLNARDRGDALEELRVYLQECTELWVHHNLLTSNPFFTDEVIWDALRRGWLRPMKQFHCYSIETQALKR